MKPSRARAARRLICSRWATSSGVAGLLANSSNNCSSSAAVSAWPVNTQKCRSHNLPSSAVGKLALMDGPPLRAG